MGSGAESIPAFLITLALIPVIGLGIVWVIREMIMLSIGAVEGIIAIGILGALFIISIVARTPIVAGAVLVVVLSLGAFYPYAESQMSRQVGREINVHKIDKAHLALSERNDNVAAWFALAEGLYRHGIQGHAIAIAEDTLNRLSQAKDDFSNRSLRDIFRVEEAALKQWKRGADPKLCKPLRCPFCSTMNPPGPIACVKCGQPYLLEIARTSDLRRKFVGKLVMGWALLALAIVGATGAGVLLKGWFQLGGVAACVIVSGTILWWLFRPAPGDQTGSFEI